MKGFIAEFLEENADTAYCVYCLDPKGDKDQCCHEKHFIPFSDLDTLTQLEIMKEEVNNAYD